MYKKFLKNILIASRLLKLWSIQLESGLCDVPSENLKLGNVSYKVLTFQNA